MLSTLGLASGSRTGQERCREAAPWGPGWRRRGECESWRGPSSMRGEDPSPGPGPGLDPLQELGWPAAAVAIKCCGVCWWRCPLSLLLDPGAGGSRDRGRAPWGSQHPGTEQGGLGLWRWSPWRPPLRRARTPQLTAWGQHDRPVPGHPGDLARKRTATGTVPGSRLHAQGQNGARGHGVVNTAWAALQHSFKPHSSLTALSWGVLGGPGSGHGMCMCPGQPGCGTVSVHLADRPALRGQQLPVPMSVPPPGCPGH